jgi:hypothetical protein
MAAAHACSGCGAALTRVRPQRDPWYGLPLVLCPGCGRAAQRRRDPVAQRTRQALRALGASGMLAVQAVVLTGLVAGSLALVTQIEDLSATEVRRFLEPPGLWFALVVAGWCVLVGGWLTAGLVHWPRWRAFAMWAALLTVLQGLVLWLDSDGAPLFKLAGRTVLPPAPDAERFVQREAIVGALLVAAALGIAPGLGMLRLTAINRRQVFRRRLRQRRQRRGA